MRFQFIHYFVLAACAAYVAHFCSLIPELFPFRQRAAVLAADRVLCRNGTTGTKDCSVPLPLDNIPNLDSAHVSTVLGAPPTIGGTTQGVIYGSTIEALASGRIGVDGTRRLAVTTSPTIVIAPYTLYVLDGAGKYRVVNISSDTTFALNSTSSSCPACTTLSAATRYYVYAYTTANFPSAAAVAYEVSTTVPNSGLQWKNGTTTRTYIGTFKTIGSNTVRTFEASNGVYTYYEGPFVNYSNVIGTSCSALTLEAPPHARAVWLRVERTDAVSSSQSAAIYNNNTCSTPTVPWCWAIGPTVGTYVRSASATCVLSASRTVYLRGSNASVAVDVTEFGFQE